MAKEVPKFGPQEVIQLVGVNKLPAEEQAVVQEITTSEYEKVKRDMHNLTDLVVHVKTYEKDGGRKKYSLHVRVNAPSVMFESSRSDDWDLRRAMHKAFEDVKNQVKHKFHSDRTRPDRY